MSKKIAQWLFEFQCKHGILDRSKRVVYEYAFNLLIIRIVVYLLMVAAGIWIGNLKEIFVFLLAFISLREYAGGFHLEKAESCIFLSGFLVCAAGWYLKYFSAPTTTTFWLWIPMIGFIWLLAPIGCKGKKLDKIEKKVYRKRARIILVIQSLLIIFILMAGYLWISKCIMLAQIILSISLIVGCLKENFFCCGVREN